MKRFGITGFMRLLLLGAPFVLLATAPVSGQEPPSRARAATPTPPLSRTVSGVDIVAVNVVPTNFLAHQPVIAGQATKLKCVVYEYHPEGTDPEPVQWHGRIEAGGKVLASFSSQAADLEEHLFDGNATMTSWAYDYEADWTPTKAGWSETSCTVDVANAVPESNEANNTKTSKAWVDGPQTASLADQPPPTAQLPQQTPPGESRGLNPQPEPPSAEARAHGNPPQARMSPPPPTPAPDNLVLEASGQPTLPKPDLVITGITGHHVKGGGAGQLQWQFWVEVTNQGPMDAGGSFLCGAHEVALAPSASKNPIPALASHQSTKVQYFYGKPTWWFVEGGALSPDAVRKPLPLFFLADCQKGIEEADENNNLYQIWLYWDPTETKTWEPAQ